MNEEKNIREAKLNEEMLEEVSGAGHHDDYRTAARTQAHMICSFCSSSYCGGTPELSLEAYLKEHGIDSVQSYHNCPYNKR